MFYLMAVNRRKTININRFYLRLYGIRHMVKDHSAKRKTRCRHMDYSFRLYAPSHRQDSTYHGRYYTSRGALAGTRYSSMCLL